MSYLAWPFAFCCAVIAVYGAWLQWLAVYKRRNDLIDRMQGFERTVDMRLMALEQRTVLDQSSIAAMNELMDDMASALELEALKRAVTALTDRSSGASSMSMDAHKTQAIASGVWGGKSHG
jgi:hypothetical protein